MARNEFITGMTKAGARNLAQLKGKLPSMRNEISSLGGLKPIYTYAFELCRNKKTSHQLMDYEVAEILWGQLFLPSVYPYIKHWLEFLKEYHKEQTIKKPITKDTWNMFYEFAALTAKDKEGINKVIDEGVWPTIIEDFAKDLKAKLKI